MPERPVTPKKPQPPDAPEDGQAEARKPGRWWHWLFLYPATTAALLTAVPQWSDKVVEIYEGLSGTQTSIAEARRRADLINKNMACLQTPELWVMTSKVNVDGTICDSGDILIRASTQDGRRAFEIFETARLLEPAESRRQAATDRIAPDLSLAGLWAGSASAAPAQSPSSPPPQPSHGDARTLAQSSFVITICQRYLDNRNLLRHVRIGSDCFDETLDTYTGQVTQRVQVPCRSTCN